jgi:hypothetical protein
MINSMRKSVPAIFFVLYIILTLSSAHGAANAHYKLSDLAVLEWGRNIELEPNPLMMHRGVWFEGDWSGKPFSVWVSRIDSRLSSLEDIKKDWLELINKTRAEGKKFIDRGCEKRGKSTIICEKVETETTSKNKTLIETHTLSRSIWHKGKDLIFVRYHAYENNSLLNDLKNNIQVVFGEHRE